MNIYDVSGRLVRMISVGFKPVGYYLTRERAVHWDGHNEIGESVASGIYFYTFTVSGSYTTTRKMLILK